MQQQPTTYTPLHQSSAIRIQSFIRGCSSRRKTRRLSKLLTYRRHIIKQLIDTEQSYIYDLSIIISDFKYPMRSLKLANVEDMNVIFTNVEEIKKLNEEFYCELWNRFQSYFHYKLVFSEVIRLTPFFKIYFEYCNNYQQGQKAIGRLRGQNKGFDEFLKWKAGQAKFRRLGIDGFLIKPVQRLPKYVILLKDLLKHTPEGHPDLKNIRQSLNAFERVNYHNNQSMSKVLSNLKLAQLQQITKSPLVQPGRQFIHQQNITILNQNDIRDVVMYLFNDLILLTQRTRQGQQVQLKLTLSRASFINEIEDMLYFKNLFLLYGAEGECCTFVCSSQEEKEKLMELISGVVARAGEKQVEKARLFIGQKIKNQSMIRRMEEWDYPVEVEVIGTEERSSNKLTKHTVYITQVKIRNVKQKIFLRYAELIQIQKYICRKFPLVKNFYRLATSTWIGNHQDKVIQERKLSIQMFLQSLLSMRQIKENGGKVLKKLGLPEDFYTLPEKFRISNTEHNRGPSRGSFFQRCSSATVAPRHTAVMMERLSSQEEDDDEAVLKRKKNKFGRNRKSSFGSDRKSDHLKKKLTVQQLLQVNQMFLGHFTRNSQTTTFPTSKDSTINLLLIPIHIYSDSLQDHIINLPVKKHQRIQHLLIQIAKQLSLMYYKDYRCFLEHDQNVRVLDDDELIQSVYGEVSKLFFKARVRFKKFIYIHPELEDREYKNDKVRLQLMSCQLLSEVREVRYRLSYRSYLVLAALYLLLNCLQNSKRNVLLAAQRFLPADVYSEFSDEEWVSDISKSYEIVYRQLKDIRSANLKRQKVFQEQLGTMPFEQVKNNMTRMDSLIRMAIINQIKTQPLYGVSLTIVQISDHTKQKFQQQTGLDFSSRNIWLGLKYDQLMFLTSETQKVIASFKYDQVVDLECFPNFIKVIMDNREMYKLKTNRSFFLSEAILYYKKYGEVYDKIIRDNEYEDLIQKAREHMQSVVMELREEAREDGGGTSASEDDS